MTGPVSGDDASRDDVARDDVAGRLAHLLSLLDEVLALADRAPIFPDVTMAGAGTVAGQTAASLADYRSARDLVAGLAADVEGMRADEVERLELNGDLPQFAFHLEEELVAQRRDLDPVALARSLTFLKRHIVRLRAEYVEEAHRGLRPEQQAVLVGLARHVRRRYREELVDRYEEVGYRRPYVDKFYRDYSLTGIPAGLLLRLADLAAADAYDRYVCVLKGGMSFTALLEAFGVAPERIVHVMAGRASGSHHEDSYLVRPVDFDLADLAGRSVLLVENNLASGRTLQALGAAVRAVRPARLGIFLDYILTDLAGVDASNLADRVGVAFDEIICGPFPAPPAGDRRPAALEASVLGWLADR